jgi:phosphoenolpyruvate carboxylase
MNKNIESIVQFIQNQSVQTTPTSLTKRTVQETNRNVQEAYRTMQETNRTVQKANCTMQEMNRTVQKAYRTEPCNWCICTFQSL